MSIRFHQLCRDCILLVMSWLALPCLGAESPGQPRVPAMEAALGPGWVCALLPNGLRPPGSVYRITTAGVIFEAKDLSKHFKPRIAPASIGAFSSEQNYSFGLLASLTGLTPYVGNASLQANASKNYRFSVVVPSATMESTEDDDPGTTAVKKWFASTKRDPNSAYFLVRAAVQAKSLAYHLGKDFAAAVTVQAQARSYLEGKVSGRLDAAEGFTLAQTFPSPVRLCLLPEQLAIGRANLDGTPLTAENVELRRDSRYFNFTAVGLNSGH